MNWHDDGPESGPSADDIAEALRLDALHRKSRAQEACLWCRLAWPCAHRRWTDEILSAAGNGLAEPPGHPASPGNSVSPGNPPPADNPLDNPAPTSRLHHPGRLTPRPICTVPLPRSAPTCGPDGRTVDPERDA